MIVYNLSSMKRLILSVVVITAFVGYAVFQKFRGPDEGSIRTVPVRITATATPPTVTSVPLTTPVAVTSGYKDGVYTGDVTDAFYGNVQVQVTISGGRLINVTFLQYPNDRNTSIEINSQATPLLAQEAIQAQSAQVDGVSGATQTSRAFIQSLQSALDKAKG